MSKVIMFDNLVNTRFKLIFLISLTLEISSLHLWLYLEFSVGAWLVSFRQKTMCKPLFIRKLRNYLNILYIILMFASMKYFRISSVFSPN